MGVLFSFKTIDQISVDMASVIIAVMKYNTLVRVTFVNDSVEDGNNWAEVRPGMRYSSVATSIAPPEGWSAIGTIGKTNPEFGVWDSWFEKRKMETESIMVRNEPVWQTVQAKNSSAVVFTSDSVSISRTAISNSECTLGNDQCMAIAFSYHVAKGESCGQLMVAFSAPFLDIAKEVIEEFDNIVVNCIEGGE